MDYISTRDSGHRVSAAQAIVSGLSPDGGLFLPESLPQFSLAEIEAMAKTGYAGRAVAVLSRFGCRAGEDPRRIDFAWVPEEEAAAFLSGAFLACGAVSDPEKGYRVEFATQHQPLADDLAALLAEVLAPPKRTVRRNDYLLYYKESENIEDLLTYLGAPKSSLELMEVKIVKELRNRVNRATNCETANISKTVNAALAQIEDIRLIEASGGVGALDEELRELARLRLQNPDMSLRELGQALTSPISRSGVNHRLRRISEYAAELRKKEHREEEK